MYGAPIDWAMEDAIFDKPGLAPTSPAGRCRSASFEVEGERGEASYDS